jgi:succinyl-diaminopimelate desuccinylase
MTLPAVHDPRDLLDQARTDQEHVVRLAQRLIRVPSRAGLDPYEPVLAELENWLRRHRLEPRLLTLNGRPVALACDVKGAKPGPHYVLDACVDTAPFGDEAAWTHPPTSGVVEDGWLHGRGSADCKTAAAIFCHLAVRLARERRQLHGSITVLFDVDEHTGGFHGVKRYLAETSGAVDGVLIGYPGLDHVVVGGRGFWRADVIAYGEAGHTGRGQDNAQQVNAAHKGAELVAALAKHRTPGPVDPRLGLSPKLTVTAVHAGEGYSIVPDRCEISIDLRLTYSFNEQDAQKLVGSLVREADNRMQAKRASEIKTRESWPAYRLPDDAPIVRVLVDAAARHLEQPPAPKVAGPSNIGNYLASCGIPATAGFGVAYAGLHGTDERIEIRTIPPVQAVYHEAVLSLLSGAIANASPEDW